MERTVHMFETFLWTFQEEWFILSHLLVPEQSSEPFNFKLHQLCAEPWCKVLSHSFFLSVEFGAIVSGTWNQPAYKNQTELQKHVVFSTNKKIQPHRLEILVLQKLLSLLLLFLCTLFWRPLLGSRPANTRKLDGAVLSVLNCLNSGQPFPPPPPFYHICFYFFFWVTDWSLF